MPLTIIYDGPVPSVGISHVTFRHTPDTSHQLWHKVYLLQLCPCILSIQLLILLPTYDIKNNESNPTYKLNKIAFI